MIGEDEEELEELREEVLEEARDDVVSHFDGEFPIEIEGLRNSFGDAVIHEDLSLKVKRGEILVDHLLAETVTQAGDFDRILAVEVCDDVRAGLFEDLLEDFIVFVVDHAQPTSVKKTAKNASSTITMKIACTTAIVVRRPTSSEFPLTCMPW